MAIGSEQMLIPGDAKYQGEGVYGNLMIDGNSPSPCKSGFKVIDLKGSYGSAFEDGGEGARGEASAVSPHLDFLETSNPARRSMGSPRTYTQGWRWERASCLLESEACHGPTL